jgi:hemerythrin
MAPYIVWKDYYSVCDELLDTQHKEILNIINELYEARQKGVDDKKIKTILDRLVKYTVDHFRREEEAMRAHQYPDHDFAQHRALHDTMRRKTLVLRENANLMTGRDMLVFLKDWWCSHIQEEDKHYAAYMKVTVEN